VFDSLLNLLWRELPAQERQILRSGCGYCNGDCGTVKVNS